MSFRTTLVLLITCIILTIVVDYVEKERRFWFNEEPDQAFDVVQGAIARVEIDEGSQVFLCERKSDEKWRIVKPVAFPAAQGVMDQVCYSLRNLRIKADAGTNLHEYGLDAPKLTVTFRTGQGAAHSLRFGSDHPSLPYVYVLIDDKKPVAVEKAIRDVFREISLNKLRDDAICDINSYRARHLEVDGNDTKIIIDRDENGWTVKHPFESDASIGDVRQLIEVLNSWAIEKYVADDVDPFASGTPYGLDHPRYRVTISGDGRSVEMVIGADAPPGPKGEKRVYVAWKGKRHVFAASAEPLQLLAHGPDTYRSRLLVRLPEPEISSFELTANDRIAKVFSVDDHWKLQVETVGEKGSEKEYRVDGDWFKGVVEALRAGEISKFVAMDRDQIRRYGFDLPLAKLVVTPHKGDAEELWVGKKDPDNAGQYFVWNRRWNYYGVAYLPVEDVLLNAPWSLRSHDPIPWEPDSIMEIALRSPDGPERVYVRPSHTWYREGGEEKAPFPSDLDRVVKDICDLQALRWERGDDDSAPGPSNFTICVEIRRIRGTTDFHPLRFWAGEPLGKRERRVREGDGGWVFRYRGKKDEVDPFAFARDVLKRDSSSP